MGNYWLLELLPCMKVALIIKMGGKRKPIYWPTGSNIDNNEKCNMV